MTTPRNLFDIQCPKCGCHDNLYILDQSDPTPRSGFRFRESEDQTTMMAVVDAGEWIPLGPWWIPEDLKQVEAFCAGDRSVGWPAGLLVWCVTCGFEAAFESFDGGLAVRVRQIKALLR